MTQVQCIAVRDIARGNNDRTTFDAGALEELAASIREHGLIQPITVRPSGDGYEIVAGERRFRACTELLGWAEVPCIVSELSDDHAAAVMLAENIARADLDPIDEAQAYSSRIALGWTVDDCANRGGVSTVRVQNRLKLLSLRDEVQGLVRSGDLSMGYAQMLGGAELDANRQTVAVRLLRENPTPTPGWFRRIVGTLQAEQAQESLFDLEALTQPSPAVDAAAFVEPPHPSTTKPPATGKTILERLERQAAYWTDAAGQWADLGKPFKRQECEAAAQAVLAACAALA